ncbi:cytoplasmic dynein 2 heavy chain 1 isoform X12 [Prionailurus iriomotensis]
MNAMPSQPPSQLQCLSLHRIQVRPRCHIQGAYGPYSPDECISLPVYTSAERDRVVTNIDVPCGGSPDRWIQCGAALFLKNQ